MALIVEDGTQKSDAESYASVADADAHFTGRTGDVEWAAAADNAAKERGLRDATDYLEERYNTRWLGVKASKDQALAWPRSYIQTADGYTIGSDEIPEKLKRACMEMAMRALTEDILPDITAGTGDVISESSSVGSLSKSTTYSGGQSTLTGYRVVDLLVREYTMGQTIQRA